MTNWHITADEHYGHDGIIEYVNRPFKSQEEQIETMIERHNKKVPNKPNYVTLHTGDLFWPKPSKDGYWTATAEQAIEILLRLNGRHAFLYGNHDELMEQSAALRSQFDWVRGENKSSGIFRMKHNHHEITICHFAMSTWNRSHKGSWMLYGHSHGEWKAPGKSFDIGVDCHDFEPWSMEEIEAEMEKHPLGHVITNVWPGKEPAGISSRQPAANSVNINAVCVGGGGPIC